PPSARPSQGACGAVLLLRTVRLSALKHVAGVGVSLRFARRGRAVFPGIVLPFVLLARKAMLNETVDVLGDLILASPFQAAGERDARIGDDAVAVLVDGLHDVLLDWPAGLLERLHETGLLLRADLAVGKIGHDHDAGGVMAQDGRKVVGRIEM